MKSSYPAILAIGIIIGTVFSRGFISSGILLCGAGTLFLVAGCIDLPEPPEPPA